MVRNRRMQKVKSLYLPGQGKKGIVAVAFDMNDPGQAALYERIRELGSTELRTLLALPTWGALERAAGARMRSGGLSAFLRERLAERVGLLPDRSDALPRSGRALPSAPAGTEDSLERARRYMGLVEERRSAGRPARIIDPFAGTGNFLVAAGERDWPSWYCENDPVALAHVRLKAGMLARSREAREALGRELEHLAATFPALLDAVTTRARRDAGEPMAAAWIATFGREPVPRATLDGAVVARAIAARKVADVLLGDAPVAGACFEVGAAWAAARCARGSGRRRAGIADFDAGLASALSGFSLLCLTGPPISEAPVLLCEDARELTAFPRLGIDAVVTTLPPFEAIDQAAPSRRVQAWMLRRPDPAPGATKVESLVRAATQPRPAGDGDSADSRGPRAREIGAFLFEGVVPHGATALERLQESVGDELGAIARTIRRSEARARPEAPTLRRAGLAAVRYFAMLSQVFDGLVGLRARPASRMIFVIEVAGTSVRGMHVDTPSMVAKLLGARGCANLARSVVETRTSTRGGIVKKEALVCDAVGDRPCALKRPALGVGR